MGEREVGMDFETGFEGEGQVWKAENSRRPWADFYFGDFRNMRFFCAV